jgi:hypothetical protein
MRQEGKEEGMLRNENSPKREISQGGKTEQRQALPIPDRATHLPRKRRKYQDKNRKSRTPRGRRETEKSQERSCPLRGTTDMPQSHSCGERRKTL